MFSLPAGLVLFDPKTTAEEEYDNGEEIRHEQSLEYAILPKKPGVYSFRPELTYFDVDSNRYLTLRSASPVNIRVGQGKNYPPAPPPSDLESGDGRWGLLSALTTLLSKPLFWLALDLPVLLALFWRLRRQQTVYAAAKLPTATKPPVPRAKAMTVI